MLLPASHSNGTPPRADYAAYFGGNLPQDWKSRVPAAIVDAPQLDERKRHLSRLRASISHVCVGQSGSTQIPFLSYAQLNDEVKACLRAHSEMVVIAQAIMPIVPANFAPCSRNVENASPTPSSSPTIWRHGEGGLPNQSGSRHGIAHDGWIDRWHHARFDWQSDETAFGVLQAGRLRQTKRNTLALGADAPSMISKKQ